MARHNDLTKEQWNEIVVCFGNRCAYCLKLLAKPQIEHVEALSKGGSHTASNVVPACFTCNRRKSDRDILSMVNNPEPEIAQV